MYCLVRAEFCNCLVTTNIRSYEDKTRFSSVVSAQFPCLYALPVEYFLCIESGIRHMLHAFTGAVLFLKIHSSRSLSMFLRLEAYGLTAPHVNMS